jgi:glycosyltransferase involved in cell wall biosynthesis
MNEHRANPSLKSQRWIALLGPRDTPTDGIHDYCEFLQQALAKRGVDLAIVHVEWKQKGWLAALRELSRESRAWKGNWVILQYTAFSWSRSGFPFAALAVLAILRRGGAQGAVFFHESFGQHDRRWIGRLRSAVQEWVVHNLHRASNKSIFPKPVENIAWLDHNKSRAASIPIGANVPEPRSAHERNGARDGVKSVAVFCLSHPPNDRLEIEDISETARIASHKGLKLHFVFFGRGTQEAKRQIEDAFQGIRAECTVLGLLGAAQVSNALACADVMLCVRGTVYSSRGSAIAGIACGVPIVGYKGPETCFPLSEAGLELVPYRDRNALAEALGRVLTDDPYWKELHRRMQSAYENYYSWERIADRFFAELSAPLATKERARELS